MRGRTLTNIPGGPGAQYPGGGPVENPSGGAVEYPDAAWAGAEAPPQSAWVPGAAGPVSAGAPLPPAGGWAPAAAPAKSKKPLIIGGVIGAVLLLVIVGVIIVVNVSGGSKSSAGDAMRGYLEALARGDAKAALSFSNDEPGEKEFLTDEILKKQIEHSPITDIKILNDDSSYGMARVHVSAKFGDKVSDETISMKKSGNDWKLDNAAIKIEPKSYGVNDDANKTLTLFGKPVADHTTYVFPGWQDWGSSNDNLEVTSEPMLLNGLGYFSFSSAKIDFKLSESGTKSVKNAIVAAIQACVASTDLEPTGCPQRIYSYRAAPNTAAWSMPDLSPMKLESFSSYSMEVRFSGNLTFPVTYRTTSGDTKSDSDNALTWGKVDITQSPLRATFR